MISGVEQGSTLYSMERFVSPLLPGMRREPETQGVSAGRESLGGGGRGLEGVGVGGAGGGGRSLMDKLGEFVRNVLLRPGRKGES